MSSLLPKRDARGRFLEQPHWLKPGWRRLNALGLGLGGSARIRCTYAGCRAVPVRGSDRCQHHDQNWRKRRLTELRTGKGRPMTPAESTRLFWLTTQNLWNRAGPWLPMATIWFAPRVEAAFAADCHYAGLPLSQLAPAIANNLRWAWQRSVLNHRDDPGWQRAVSAGRRRQIKIGLAPGNYVYKAPSTEPPTDSRIRVVLRRAAAWAPASANSVVDRTTRAKQRRQRLAPIKTPASFNWRTFLGAHWLSLFSQLFKAHRLDPAEADGEVGRQLATAWHAVLIERERLGDGTVGPAQRRWYALLRTLDDYAGRPVPAKAPAPMRSPSPRPALVGHSDNAAWLAELCAKTDAGRS